MAKTTAWHSLTESVYHYDTDCPEGKKINPKDRQDGEGGRKACKVCMNLPSQY